MKRISLFSWYLLGQVIFFILPYIIIKLTNTDFKYVKYDKATDIIGIIVLCLSNCIVLFIYKLLKMKSSVKKRQLKSLRIISNSVIVWIKMIIYMFVIFSFLFCIYHIADIGITNISNNMILRARLSKLGPFAIVLMFPIGLSTYYWIKMIDGYSEKHIISKTMFLTVVSFIVGYSRGQRTDLILVILLPLLYLFIKKRNVKLLIYGAIGIVSFAAIYAMYFKVNTQGTEQSLIAMMKKIVIGEFDRNWTYWLSLGNSTLVDNTIMNDPYYGYFYTLLTYVPRSFVPFKGYSTESYFVYFMGNYYVNTWRVASLAQVNWGITLSGITEALINGGYIGVLFYSVIVGCSLSILDKISNKYVYMSSCIPLIVLLISGYTFYNIIVIYSPILLTLYIFNRERYYA